MQELNLRTKKKLSSRIAEILIYFFTWMLISHFFLDETLLVDVYFASFNVIFIMFILNPILNRWNDWLEKKSKDKEKQRR